MSIWTTPKPGDGRPVDVLSPIQAATAFSDYPPRSVPTRAVDRPFVTALPIDPQDGDEIRFLADDTNGIVWSFRYRVLAPSAYHWEFIGGACLFGETTTADTTTSTTYNNPSGGLSTGPSLTIPLSGQYEVAIGAGMFQTTGGVGYMSYSIGAASAVDADAIIYGGTATSVNNSKSRIKTIAANDILLCVYKTTANTLNIFDRWIRVTPRIVRR